jgi:hypothetical protein
MLEHFHTPSGRSAWLRLQTFVATFVANFVEIPIRNRDDKGCDKGCDEVLRSPSFWDWLRIGMPSLSYHDK